MTNAARTAITFCVSTITKRNNFIAIIIIGLFVLPVFAFAQVTSLNGQTGATQTFANDTNFTITSNSDVHTLGWDGVLSAARGGLGVNASSFTAGAIPFFDGSVFANTSNLQWDGITDSLKVKNLFGTNNETLSIKSQGQGQNINIIASNSTNDIAGSITMSGGYGENESGGQLLLEGGTGQINGGGISIIGGMSLTESEGRGGGVNINAGDSNTGATGARIEINGGYSSSSGGSLILYGGRTIPTDEYQTRLTLYGDETGGIDMLLGRGLLRIANSIGIASDFDFSNVTDERTFTLLDESGTFPLLESSNTFSNPVNNFISATNSTVHVGADGIPGCIVMGDSDGSGVTYVTANDGVLSASTTAPANCN